MKTLKVEAVYPMAFETFEDVVEHLPHFIEEAYNNRRLHSVLGYLSLKQLEDQHVRQTGQNAACSGAHPKGCTPLSCIFRASWRPRIVVTIG